MTKELVIQYYYSVYGKNPKELELIDTHLEREPNTDNVQAVYTLYILDDGKYYMSTLAENAALAHEVDIELIKTIFPSFQDSKEPEIEDPEDED